MKLLPAILLVALQPIAAEPFIVAHRGASANAPENTLPAFRLAWEQGANAIEGDFHLTKDNQIVCLHDKDTKEVASKKLVVSQSTLAELQRLDVGVRRGPSWKGTRIPTLEDVIQTIPEYGEFYLEIKCGPEIVPHVLASIEKLSFPISRLRIISFSTEVIAKVEQRRPEIRTGLLRKFKKNLGYTQPRKKEVLRELLKCGADALSTNAWKGIDDKFIAQLESLGKEHHVWTINDAGTAQRFLALGSTSITTDRPGALREEIGKTNRFGR